MNMSYEICALNNLATQPPYSPDLATGDFFLFPSIKKELEGPCLESIQVVQDTWLCNLNLTKYKVWYYQTLNELGFTATTSAYMEQFTEKLKKKKKLLEFPVAKGDTILIRLNLTRKTV